MWKESDKILFIMLVIFGLTIIGLMIMMYTNDYSDGGNIMAVFAAIYIFVIVCCYTKKYFISNKTDVQTDSRPSNYSTNTNDSPLLKKIVVVQYVVEV
jgi:hypothetical protein